MDSVPRGRGRLREADDFDLLMQEWAAWVQTKARFVGWGSGVDAYDRMLRPGKRNPGSYSDPTFAEFMSALADGQSRQATVHGHILRYPCDWRRVTAARYVGRPVVKRIQRITCSGEIEWGAGPRMRWQVRMASDIPHEYQWSGMLAWAEVALVTGIPSRTCEQILAQVRRVLILDIQIDKWIQRGRIGDAAHCASTTAVMAPAA